MKSRWVKYTVAIVGVIALVIAAVAGYGATQPRDHEASRTVELNMAPAEAFAILTDFGTYGCWRDEIERVDVEGNQFVEHGPDGDVRYEVVERLAPSRLVVRIADDDLPYGGTWTYELAPVGTGATSLTITERGFIDSVVVRGLAAMLMDPTDSIVRVQSALQHYTPCE